MPSVLFNDAGDEGNEERPVFRFDFLTEYLTAAFN